MLNRRLLARIDAKKAQLDALRPLPPSAGARLNETMTLEWIYNSNAIEGSTLTLRETQLILAHGLTIGGKSLREHFEVVNHRDAIAFVQSLTSGKGRITPFQVRQIHQLVLARIDDAEAGKFRTVNVRVAGASYAPPEPFDVPRLMDEWSRWLARDGAHLHSVARAALAHHRLVAIHPFVDGNGRTARLVMNLLLMRDGYPPAVIQRANRRQYYRVLAQADAGKVEPLANFVGRAVEHSLTLYLQAAQPAGRAARSRWIPLREAARGTPYSQEYLSLLARTGQLEAIKVGRVWHTTGEALERYLHSRGR